MNELSLFTGAGGGLLGTKLLGWNPIGYVEWDDYCQRVIAARIKDGLLPNAPIFGDIKTFISDGYAESYQGMVDVVTGGFPCQDISICKKNAEGIWGARSGLWKEMAEVIRIVRPRYALVENSPALTFRGLGEVLRDLAEMGFDARWGVLGGYASSDVGLLRERLFIVAVDNEKHGQRLQIQSRIDVESTIWRNHAPTNILHADEDWLVAHGYAMRTIDDVAGTMDRVKAIGNGQIPAVVRAAWEILTGGKCTAQQ